MWQYNGDKKECPIYYASWKMSAAERKYTTTERKALAVVYACKKLRHYLLRYRIVFHTDHDSFKYLVNKPDLSGRIARWVLLLQEFNYKQMVKPEKGNSHAVFLSRQRGSETVEDMSVWFPNEFPEDNPQVQEESMVFHIHGEEASEFRDLIEYLTEHKYLDGLNREEKAIFQSKVAPYTLIREVLFKMGPGDQLRRCLEQTERRQVRKTLHSGPSGGHFATNTTINRIRFVGY